MSAPEASTEGAERGAAGRTTIEVVVNGAPREVPAETTIAGLVALLALRAEQVAVEHNAEIVRRDEREERVLAAGDVLEVVTLVGGG